MDGRTPGEFAPYANRFLFVTHSQLPRHKRRVRRNRTSHRAEVPVCKKRPSWECKRERGVAGGSTWFFFFEDWRPSSIRRSSSASLIAYPTLTLIAKRFQAQIPFNFFSRDAVTHKPSSPQPQIDAVRCQQLIGLAQGVGAVASGGNSPEILLRLAPTANRLH